MESLLMLMLGGVLARTFLSRARETVKMIYQHSQVMILSRFKFPEAYKVHPNIFAWLAILFKVSDSVWQAADKFVLGCKEIQENCKDEKMCENYNVITTEICESCQNADSIMKTFCLFYNFQLRSMYTV